MARVRFPSPIAVAVLATLIGVAAGQPPLPTRGGSQLKPLPGGPKWTALPAEPDVEDFRPYLEGKFPRPPGKGMDEKAIKELLEKLNKLPKDQQPDKAQIDDFLKNNPNFKNPEFLKQLEKMLQDPNFEKNLPNHLPDNVRPPDKDHAADLKHKLEELVQQGKQEGPPPIVGKEGELPKFDPKVPAPGTLPDPSQTNPAVDSEWVKWMEKNFGDSPQAQEAVKELVNSFSKTDLKGVFDDVPELKGEGWKDITDWGKSNGLDPGKIRPPDISSSQGGSPNLGGGGTTFGGGGGGGGSSFGGGGGGGGVGLGGGGTALAVIAGIAAAAFLALLLFRRWKAEQERRAAYAVAAGLGIDLDAIRTREELVRAFDHVSLDQIGEEARPWNHRVIADQIAGTRPAQAAPAVELAGLYERARYAPDDEDLSAGEFADARRDLRTIAGVAP